MFCPGSGTKQAQPKMEGVEGAVLILQAAFAEGG
jgi:hypothetical protein